MYSHPESITQPGEPAPPAATPADVSPAAQEPTADIQPPPPQLPAPDNAPSTAQDGGVTIQVPGMAPIVPLTRQQVNALEKRGSELSDAITSAQSRRDDIARDLERATLPSNRTGLEERLRFLDARILKLEQEIDANSSAKASLEANYSATSSDGGSNSFTIDPSVGPLAFMVLLPISLAIARSIWRRSSRKMVQTALPQADARFEQLEQAIDTVAVEIERVAEGQRFVTRMLREGQPVPDFSGAQAPDSVRVRSHQEDAG